MLVLGLTGGVRRVDEPSPASGGSSGGGHDGAAVLLADGAVVAACEQARLDRTLRSGALPLDALRRCLELAGVGLEDVDHVAWAASEGWTARALGVGAAAGRAALAARLGAEPGQLLFVKHHLAHAASAFGASGWDEALVCTFDEAGEDESGLVAVCRGRTLSVKATLPLEASLGRLFREVGALLGFAPGDEAELEGLAAGGDAGAHRDALQALYTLEPEGRFRLHLERLPELRGLGRARGEPVSRAHADLAAGLVEAVLLLELHGLEHARRLHGMRRLCLAGGVAQNGLVNAEVARSGIFDEVFVQPAAHAAGCALGAALAVHLAVHEGERPRPRHVAWGTDVGHPEGELVRWIGFVVPEEDNDLLSRAARRLAAGDVVGWAHGRAEFSPRALGRRAVLADARSVESAEAVRQAMRWRWRHPPISALVPLEDAHAWFELGEGEEVPFGTQAVPARREHRRALAGVLAADGAARVVTVARDVDERLWSLLRAFGERTGTPVLLCGPLRGPAEPIAESCSDAVATLLTTDLDALVVGDFWITRRKDPSYGALAPRLPRHVRLERLTTKEHGSDPRTLARLVPDQDPGAAVGISIAACDLLLRADGRTRLEALTKSVALLDELHALWCDRLVILEPMGPGV